MGVKHVPPFTHRERERERLCVSQCKRSLLRISTPMNHSDTTFTIRDYLCQDLDSVTATIPLPPTSLAHTTNLGI